MGSISSWPRASGGAQPQQGTFHALEGQAESQGRGGERALGVGMSCLGNLMPGGGLLVRMEADGRGDDTRYRRRGAISGMILMFPGGLRLMPG